MMEFKWIEKYYQDKGLDDYCLRNINFKVNDGEFVKIMRPSGNCRSVLMYLFASLNIKSGGEYVFYDYSTLVDQNNPKVGFILRGNLLIKKLSVYENIEAPLINQNLQCSERKKRVNKVLKEFNLSIDKDFFPNQLSKFKQLLVSIARSVVSNPRLIIANDPCESLDQTQCNIILEIFTKMNNRGITILLATSVSNLIAVHGKVINLFDKENQNEKRQLAIN